MTNTALRTNNTDNIVSTNPGEGFNILGEVQTSSDAEINGTVSLARNAQKAWGALSLEKRIDHMRDLYTHLLKSRDAFVHQTAQEMGMPVKLAGPMTDGGFDEMLWNIDNAIEGLSSEILYEDDVEVNEAIYEPHGVMASIMPWNFPFPNFARSPVQALLAGNTVVIKYSEEVPLFSKLLQDCIEKSDMPKGTIGFVYGDGQVGDVLTNQDVDYISFTGSSATGTKIYQKAAAKLLPVELELGGSSPGVVFADCDLDDNTVETIFARRFANSGQFCSGLKRLIVHKSKYAELTEKLVALTKTKSVGNPVEPSTDLGPLVAARQVDAVEVQVEDARAKGATILCGGHRIDSLQGAYYAPTLITDITRDMKVWSEEVFGPALAIISFDTYEEAIELANDTEYGLSGFVFTKDKALAKQAMMDIQAGSLQQNSCNYQRPCNPFGGYKTSGIGRQRGIRGFKDVTQTKVIAWEK